MENEKKVKELIRRNLPTREKECLSYLKDYSDLISSNRGSEDEKIVLWNLLNITGINMKEFQKDMRELKISYTDVYQECLNLEKEL